MLTLEGTTEISRKRMVYKWWEQFPRPNLKYWPKKVDSPPKNRAVMLLIECYQKEISSAWITRFCWRNTFGRLCNMNISNDYVNIRLQCCSNWRTRSISVYMNCKSLPSLTVTILNKAKRCPRISEGVFIATTWTFRSIADPSYFWHPTRGLKIFSLLNNGFYDEALSLNPWSVTLLAQAWWKFNPDM